MASGASKYQALRKRKQYKKMLRARREAAGLPVSDVASKQPSSMGSSSEYKEAVTQIRNTSPRTGAKGKNASQRRVSALVSLALHGVAIFVAGIYVVREIAVQDDSMVADMMEAIPDKRVIKREPKQRQSEAPKLRPLAAPRTQPIATSARLTIGNERFTLPAGNLSLAITDGPSSVGLDRGSLFEKRQATVATVAPKFEPPKFDTTPIISKFDESQSFSEIAFSPESVDTFSADLGNTRGSFTEFLKQVREKIKRAQRFPPAVRNAEDGATTKVRFTLLRDGTIQHAKVVASSGSKSLDNAALAAVRNAIPFPPFPEDQNGSMLRLELPIVFQLRTN